LRRGRGKRRSIVQIEQAVEELSLDLSFQGTLLLLGKVLVVLVDEYDKGRLTGWPVDIIWQYNTAVKPWERGVGVSPSFYPLESRVPYL